VAIFAGGRASESRAASAAAELVAQKADELSQALTGADEAARVRADALAALPVVRAAILTDVETVKDIERTNTVFTPAKNEAIELFQLAPERTVTLLRAPAKAQPLELDGSELALAEDGDSLAVTVSAQVVPMYADGGETRGRVAIRRRVPLAQLRERLERGGLVATLVGLPGKFVGPLVLAGDASAAHLTISARVPFENRALTLSAARAHPGGAAATFGLVLALLGLAGAGASELVRRRSRPVVPASVPASAPAPAEGAPPWETVTAPLHTVANRRISDELPSLPMLVPLTPELPARGEAPAAVLVAGKYRVIQPIGAGAESEVYLAQTLQQLGVPKVVALKLVRPWAELPPERLLEAAQHAARVQHANVVRLHDFGVADGRFYLAMEYVEGCSTAFLLDALHASNEKMPLKQSLAIAIGMCKGLEAAHAVELGGLKVPVLHRDLRPSSVLIGRHGTIKLSDFGAVRPRPSPFMPPEQQRGAAFDVRADTFAVGMILRALVAGVPVPRSLDAVVAKATHRWPRRRYDSAALLRTDLEDVSEAIAEAPSSGVLGDWVERVKRSHG
jgi:hypothetical protein